MKRRFSPGMFVIFSAILTLATILIAPMVGLKLLSFQEILQGVQGGTNPDALIFFKIRLPRVFAGLITGASLAVAGVLFQALLRNPLATPYTLGVSSGGALGAVLAIKLGLSISFLGFSAIHAASFLGSIVTIFLVFLLSRQFGKISILTMILAGVTVSFLAGAFIMLIHFLADFTQTRQMIRWTMGGLDTVQSGQILPITPLLLLVFMVTYFYYKTLNILSLSDDTARSKGVDVSKIQILLFILGSFLTGIVVAVAGPIGFVGLIIPHLVRGIIGPNHRYLLPASFLLGGTFLVWSDTIARTILAPAELPVGIVTAIVGGPLFLFILYRYHHSDH
ncbi:MAG: iron ABC transporter permease [Calditrichia bacterium]